LEFKVDKHSIVGNNTRLQCEYDLQGEQLYTVKWYKDDNEFYRFLPGESPEVQMFNITGVYVDQKHSTAESIVLRALGLESSGQYRCEVTVDAPSFQTVTNCSVLTVAMPGGSHILEVDLSPTHTSSASSTESTEVYTTC